MRPLRNVLYVQTQESWLHKDGENLVMNVDGKAVGRVPVHMLQGLVCFGQVAVSPYLMAHCAKNGITITFLDRHGKFLARVEGPVSGNVLLRRKQHLLSADAEVSVGIAKSLLTGKVYNQRAVVRRYLRDYGDTLPVETLTALQTADKQLSHRLDVLPRSLGIDDLMGREGDAARLYFEVFPLLIRNPDFTFSTRERRPPRDPVNALLSLFYTLLTHDCRSALETTGLDPACGFLHQLRPGRPSLALDLAEEFRAMVDRFVLSVINRRQVRVQDFEFWPNGAVSLKHDARKSLLAAWQDRKQEEITHPWFEERVPVGQLPWLQAQLLAGHLRGDLDGYAPFLWK
ncbi:CRISPR-associated Cas1 family protein [Fluviicoccus keumensis]|uniref:CRISPR-associated endonuclease Cas1 n=1 Tax=Fluviicoccus keumensis TaxID=1435465 RepID=A0A4Q7YLL8_9GAMM|nr:type I-C CRISPR-associated endonuclease Cas1c [Fluviicoccus keumensis]RZU38230.1 CRISPR-associated Cas1 family protein [Fluviicoccus keumensis]